MKMKGFRALSVLPTALCALVLIAGCDSVSNDKEAPPPLPPDAFTMQTDLFETNSAGKAALGTNFVLAAGTVWPVSLILKTHLIIPALVTSAAVQAGDPKLEDGTFVWASSTQVESNPFSFTLSANPTGDHIDWSMRVEGVDPETQQELDFVLFTAQTNPNTKSGTWSLFYPTGGTSTNVLNAEFAITGDSEKSISFSVPDGQEHGGDSVTYSQDGSTRTFVWEEVSAGATHTVSWDATTHAGWIEATGYNDEQRACWDAELNDAECAL